MKIFAAFSIFACLLCTSSFGQGTPDIDSLKSAYYADPSSPELLLGLIDYYKSEDLDSLNYYINQHELLHPDSRSDEIALKRAEGYLLFNKMDSAEAILNALEIDEHSDRRLFVSYLIATSKVLEEKKEFDQVLERLYSGVEQIKSHDLEELLPEIYSEIAFVLSQNNDLENCKKYYGYAFEGARAYHNVKLQVDICHQLCRIYNGGILVNLDSSIHYGLMGLEIAKVNNYEYGYANMLFLVSAPIIRNGQYRQGLEMSREALMLADKYNFPMKSRYYLVLNQGFSYEKLGIYDSAVMMMQMGAKIRPVGIDHYRLQYLIYKSQGDFEKALPALEVYEAKKDSIIATRNESKLSSLQARHEANLKEREVADLTRKTDFQELQLSQQRSYLVGLVILVVFIVSGGVLLYRQRRLRQQKAITDLELEETRKRLKVEQQYRASELKALRSQMNPHFVFNALNSIQEYIMLNEKKLAGKYLGKFADLMRTYLNHSQKKAVTVQEEVDALNLYLELEKLRFEDALDYEILMDEAVDPDEIRLPALLIQPFVENALKHGLLHKRQERKLSVRFGIAGDFLKCEIMDNGIGRQASAEINKKRNPAHKSYATGAIQERIELINYSLQQPVSEMTEDLNDPAGKSTGTRVVLSIPIVTFAGLEV